jgi:xylulokinase
MLGNDTMNCSLHGLNFNIHDRQDILRASQEGIAFSYEYGMEIMREELEMDLHTIKAGRANMFLSPIFTQTLSNVTGATIELYNTDGAAGAARGAGIGAGIYASFREAFASLEKLSVIEPDADREACEEACEQWRTRLFKLFE